MIHIDTLWRKALRVALGVLMMAFVWFAAGFVIGYFFMTPFPSESQFRQGVDAGLLCLVVSLASGPFIIKWWKRN